jgi:nucleoid-associated protein YgaU
LDSMHLEISNVGISVDGSSVTVDGEAADQATKEKVTLTLGNVEGIDAVDNNMTVAEETEESRFYEVQKGDSLWKIATEMYSDGSRYQEIVDANQPMIKNADLIYPGQQLRIP